MHLIDLLCGLSTCLGHTDVAAFFRLFSRPL
jgi:hypothetical protein